MSSFYRQQLEAFLKTLNIKANLVYDIGGKQKTIKGRTKTWEVQELITLDIPEFDLNEPQKVEKPADIIFCLEVFEYLIDPLTAMKNISMALKPGGTAYVSFPLIYPLHNEIEYDSLRYTNTGITRLANKTGLSVKKMNFRRSKTATLIKYYSEDGMRMAKGQPHDITGYIAELTK